MRLLVLLVAAVAAVGAIRYDGYRVIEVDPLNDKNRTKIVADLADDDERIRKVILLDEHVRWTQPVHLAVAPDLFNRTSGFLNAHGFSFSVINEDLQRTFDEARNQNEEAAAKWRKSGSKAAPTAYLQYADQIAWLRSAAAGSSIASTFTIGTSYEGRTLEGIAINAGSNLPTIWIDSNLHAREWITSASVLYVIDQILTGTSADAVNMRTNYRWYILPNGNPDGYEYTWAASGDRLWRKTRGSNVGSVCVGTDANRNWAEGWGGEGSSTSPCSETYMGDRAFSERETAAMRDFLASIASTTNVAISFHAYSQLWLMPWGCYTYKPADYSELLRVGNLAVDAIQGVNGLRFQAGTPPDLLYVASGGEFDYTKAQQGIKYGYSPELRPATELQGGFELPPSNIYPSGAEIFAAIVAVAKNAQHKV